MWSKKDKDQGQPRDPESIVDKALGMYGGGSLPLAKREKIRSLLADALRLRPDIPAAYVILGHLEMDEKNLDRMQEYFLKALEVADDPYNAYTWDWVTTCLDDGLRDYRRLIGYLLRFYDREPESFVVDYLAKTYIKIGEPENALRVLDRHLARFPDDAKVNKLRIKIQKKG